MRRALVGHGGWLVAASATAPLGLDGATAQLAYFGEETALPEGELWVFTDTAAASFARDRGAALGHYIAEIHGQDLFGVIAPEYDLVRVNPLCEMDITCAFEGDALQWLRTAAVEHSIESALAAAETHLLASTARRLREHPAFLALRTGERTLLTRPSPGNEEARVAVAFSAEDCLKAFLSQLLPEEAADLDIVGLGGVALFAEVAGSELEGVLFNPEGPGPSTLLSRAIARTLAG